MSMKPVPGSGPHLNNFEPAPPDCSSVDYDYSWYGDARAHSLFLSREYYPSALVPNVSGVTGTISGIVGSGQAPYLEPATGPHGPVLILDSNNGSCRSQFATFKDDYVTALAAYVGDQWNEMVTDQTKGVLMSVYLPFKTGLIVEMAFVFQFFDDGSIDASEYVHVKPVNDEVSENRLILLYLLAIPLLLIATERAWRSGINALGEVYFPEEADPDFDHKKKSALFKLVLKWVVWTGGWIAFFFTVLIKFDEGWANGFGNLATEQPNRLLSMLWPVMYFYISILVCELVQLEEGLFSYLKDPWNYLDICAMAVGFAVPIMLSISAQIVGEVDSAISEWGIPWAAWREWSGYLQAERDPTNGIITGLALFFLVLRIFKSEYLSIFPMMTVSFWTLLESGKELVVFVLVLCLFCFAFQMVRGTRYLCDKALLARSSIILSLCLDSDVYVCVWCGHSRHERPIQHIYDYVARGTG